MLSIAPNLLTTQRLILRQWHESDRPAFARLNADPVVRQFFPKCLTRDESDADAARIQKTIEERGWGFWAVEVKGSGATGASQPDVTAAGESDITARGESDATATGASGVTARGESGVASPHVVAAGAPRAAFIGFVGLWVPSFTSHFTPCVEIGWRLAKEHWGNGYATEAAVACLRFGFENLTLQQIVAFTAPLNKRSTAVMERIGMSRNPADDFDHPNVPPGDPLRRHVLYRMNRSDWEHLYVPRDAQLT
ncbi:MAG: hypothetical protein QOI59_2079 [Gammaproteobacteria bacterium]|nr:hypothetical protein [Gammaproteobacteria bacterium]